MFFAMVNKDEKKRDEVLKRMLNTPPESNKELAERRKTKRNNPSDPLHGKGNKN